MGDTCLNYLACSDDSDEGFCPQARSMTSCDPWNVCRTCDGFSNEKSSSSDGQGGVTVGDGNINNNEDGEDERDEYGCRAVPEESIPKVTISEFGMIEPGNIHAIKAEIYARYGDEN